MIDPALPPQHTETFRFPKCLAATARRSVKFFPYPVGRTAKTYRPAALQPSKHPNVWGLALDLENRVFKSKTQHGIELDVCTAHMKNKSDLEPDSGPRNRILPDLVSSSPFPSLYFLSSNRKNEIWGRDQLRSMTFVSSYRKQRTYTDREYISPGETDRNELGKCSCDARSVVRR